MVGIGITGILNAIRYEIFMRVRLRTATPTMSFYVNNAYKEVNPKKGLFGGTNMPKKCPVCGVGELADISS